MDAVSKLFDGNVVSCHTDIGGVTNAIFEPFTVEHRRAYGLFFSIMDAHQIKYFLFAGSAVGYVRNKRMPLWMDDLDVIIFEDQIERFEEIVIPELSKRGFSCVRPSPPIDKGGFHVLADMLSWNRGETVSYSTECSIPIPWVQVDVFYTTVDEKGLIRSTGGWGLYHQKDIPLEWVVPGQMVDFDGFQVRMFSKIEEDVLKEYGDVKRELVIATHNKVFYRSNEDDIDATIKKIDDVYAAAHQLPPRISQDDIDGFRQVPGEILKFEDETSFEEMISAILASGAEKIELHKLRNFVWISDLRRVIRSLHISCHVMDEKECRWVAFKREQVDHITYENSDLKCTAKISFGLE